MVDLRFFNEHNKRFAEITAMVKEAGYKDLLDDYREREGCLLFESVDEVKEEFLHQLRRNCASKLYEEWLPYIDADRRISDLIAEGLIVSVGKFWVCRKNWLGL